MACRNDDVSMTSSRHCYLHVRDVIVDVIQTLLPQRPDGKKWRFRGLAVVGAVCSRLVSPPLDFLGLSHWRAQTHTHTRAHTQREKKAHSHTCPLTYKPTPPHQTETPYRHTLQAAIKDRNYMIELQLRQKYGLAPNTREAVFELKDFLKAHDWDKELFGWEGAGMDTEQG